jgi:hypothetical protein
VLLPSLRRLLLLPSGDDDQALSGPFSAHSPGLSLTLTRRGFYPKGGGEAVLQVPALAQGAALPSMFLPNRSSCLGSVSQGRLRFFTTSSS